MKVAIPRADEKSPAAPAAADDKSPLPFVIVPAIRMLEGIVGTTNGSIETIALSTAAMLVTPEGIEPVKSRKSGADVLVHDDNATEIQLVEAE